MPDRLRALSATPIPGRRARLIFVGCVALVLALAAAALLDRGHSHVHAAKAPAPPIVLEAINPPATPSVPSTSSRTRRRIAAQDPQAHRGTPAARRAARASSAHRALQHVPYRHDGVSIRLTGARPDGEAILSVTAPTIRRARAGYRHFLARYHDAGRAYAPRFRATGSGVRARG